MQILSSPIICQEFQILLCNPKNFFIITCFPKKVYKLTSVLILFSSFPNCTEKIRFPRKLVLRLHVDVLRWINTAVSLAEILRFSRLHSEPQSKWKSLNYASSRSDARFEHKNLSNDTHSVAF